MAPKFPRFEEAMRAEYPTPPADLPGRGEDHSFKTITIWNRTGGIAKTTTTHALGFAYAVKGRRVLMVDADPQCGLSSLLLHEWVEGQTTLEEIDADELDYDLFYNHQVPGQPHKKNNLKDALAPVMEIVGAGSRTPLEQWGPADVTKIPLSAGNDIGDGMGALFLLPGHEDLVDYEEKVTVAYGTNLMVEAAAPGAWNKLIALTARKCGADIVLVDCNPHRGRLNMHIILTSDYLLVPCAPDIYSCNAIMALPAIMEDWVATRHNARSTGAHAQLPLDVQIPSGNPRILGVSVMFTQMRSKPARNFQFWMTRIEDRLRLISEEIHAKPALAGMAGTPGQPSSWPSVLAEVPDFNQLAAMSHYYGVPVIALGPALFCTWDGGAERMVPLNGKAKTAMSKKIMTLQVIFRKFVMAIGNKAVEGPLVVEFAPDDDSDEGGGENVGDNVGNFGRTTFLAALFVLGIAILSWRLEGGRFNQG